MPLLRFAPTTSDRVVFAPSRKLRPPDSHAREDLPQSEPGIFAHCPFCPENEALMRGVAKNDAIILPLKGLPNEPSHSPQR